MSGRKCSEYQLQQERAERLRLLQTLANLRSEANGLRERVQGMLSSASPGLRSTFSAEVQRAERWLTPLELPEAATFDMTTSRDVVDTAHRRLQLATAEGRRAFADLTLAFTQKADALGCQLAARLAEAERSEISHRELIGRWFGRDAAAAIQGRVDEARGLLDTEQYATLEQALVVLDRDLEGKGKEADLQEEKHQKRLYLLKALRQVCAEMGFEDEPPRFETEGQLASRIVLKVDTVDRGRIDFYLTLDGISSLSELAEGRCFEEFSKLSQFLDEEFGVQTEFKMESGEPIPRLIQKGELDFPDDVVRQAECDTRGG